MNYIGIPDSLVKYSQKWPLGIKIITDLENLSTAGRTKVGHLSFCKGLSHIIFHLLKPFLKRSSSKHLQITCVWEKPFNTLTFLNTEKQDRFATLAMRAKYLKSARVKTLKPTTINTRSTKITTSCLLD